MFRPILIVCLYLSIYLFNIVIPPKNCTSINNYHNPNLSKSDSMKVIEIFIEKELSEHCAEKGYSKNEKRGEKEEKMSLR